MSSDEELIKDLNSINEESSIDVKDEVSKTGSSYYGDEDNLVTDQEISQLNNAAKEEAELESKYGNRPITAAALGGAQGLSLGTALPAAIAAGMITKEEANEIITRNEGWFDVGDVGTTAAAILASGGTAGAVKGAAAVGAKAVGKKAIAKGITSKLLKGAAAPLRGVTKAGLATEELTKKALGKILKESATDSAAKRIVKGAIPKMLGSAVEGSAFGAQQFLTETSIGRADANAENLLSSVGVGALMGGAAAGIFEAPKALKPLGKKVAEKSGKITDKLTKYGNANEAVLDILGAKATQREFIKKNAPDFFQDSPEWFAKKAEMGYFTSSKKLYNNVLNIKEEAGARIGDIVKEIDIMLKNIPEGIPGMPSKGKIYGRAASQVQSVIDEFKDIPGARDFVKTLKKDRNDYIKMANDYTPISISEIFRQKVKTDEIIKYSKGFENFTLREKAMNRVRDVFSSEIDNAAKLEWVLNRDSNLSQRLLEANKDYRFAAISLPHLSKKVNQAESRRGILSLSDMLIGGAGLSGDAVTLGGAVLSGKKFLESDLRRRIQILSSIERQNSKVASNIKSGVSKFFKSGTTTPRLLSTKALTKSNLSLDHDEPTKKPKDKQQAFKNIKKNLVDISTNPEKFAKKMLIRTSHLTKEAPQTTAMVSLTAQNGVEFLLSKIPKPYIDSGRKNIFTKREWQPSDVQIAKFERYVEVVENPMSVMDDLESGTLTREAAEALQVVYPNIYKNLQTQVMDTLNTSEDVVPYSKRIQLGILLNIPSDTSMEPDSIRNLQANFISEEETQQIEADDIDRANREQTLAQQAITRE